MTGRKGKAKNHRNRDGDSPDVCRASEAAGAVPWRRPTKRPEGHELLKVDARAEAVEVANSIVLVIRSAAGGAPGARRHRFDLLKHLGTTQDALDFGGDGFGQRENEPVGTPGPVDSCGQTLVAGKGTAQEIFCDRRAGRMAV